MLTINKRLAQGRGLSTVLLKRAPTVELDWDVRCKSRFEAVDSSGRSVAVFLPRGQVLRGGDVLVAEDGSLLRVVAALQPLLVVRACAQHGSPFDLLRAAYHLGNRHVQLELQTDRLQLEPDHVLAALMRQMHLIVGEEMAPFEPEAGAYAQDGHAHAGHTEHGHDHNHAHEHGHGHRTEIDDLTPQAFLQLMQLASPALPVGGFSYSEGLESAVDAGLVVDENHAGNWLADQLQLSLARADLPAMAQAFTAWQRADLTRIGQINDWLNHTRESAESRQQIQQMGRSMAEWLKHREGADERTARLAKLQPAPTWPVAFALATVLTGAALRPAMLAFAFGWAENMVQAAMRCVPLGQIAGQRLLARLIDATTDAVPRAADLGDDERQAFTPMLAILGARHETQYSRLFRS